MRPVPKARHTIAIAVFGLVSTAAGILAALEDHVSEAQANMMVNVVRSVEPGLYAKDPLFGASQLWRLHNPVWQWYLRESYRATGGADLRLPFSMSVAVIVFVYLVGMYGLLWRQVRSWSVACYTAVLSTAVIPVATGCWWGLGPLATMTPGTVVMALTPLLVWAFVARCDSVSVLWVFLAVGLAGNIHLASASALAAVLAIVLVGRRKLHWRGWLLAAAGIACAIGAASPILWYYQAQRVAFDAGGLRWLAAGLLGPTTVDTGGAGMLGEALEFPALAYLLALWIPAIAVMIRSERFWVRDLASWIWMLLAALGIALIGQWLCRTAPPGPGPSALAIHMVHAVRLTLAPLYVLWAQGVVHLFRSGTARHALRITLGVILCLWLVPADNLAVPRHWMQATAVGAVSPDERPQNVQNRLDRSERRRELQAICAWLAENTPADTVVACSQPHARLWARRALVTSWTDRPYYSYLAPGRVGAWQVLFAEQTEALIPRRGGPASPAILEQFARRHGAAFVILQAEAAPPDAPRQAWVQPAEGRWGEHWMLYRPGVESLGTEPATAAAAK